MKKASLLVLAAILAAATVLTAEPVTLYRIDLHPGTDAYRFAAENALPVYHVGAATLLVGLQPEARRFTAITSVSAVYGGDTRDLRWVHVRRKAGSADPGLARLYSADGMILVSASEVDRAKGLDRASFMVTEFPEKPIVMPVRAAIINPGLEYDPAVDALAQAVTIANFESTVDTLQAFNTRSTIAPNHQQVAEWIRDKFLSFGIADVEIDSFVNLGFTNYVRQYYGVTDSAKMRNVIATIPGLLDTSTVYIVGGHYDSSVWPYNPWAPGADDNGSGTAAAIEMARIMAGNRPNTTVKFVAFDCEEWGLFGCDKFAADALANGTQIGCMLNYDMIANLGDDSLFNCYSYDGSELFAQLSGQSARWYGRTADTNLVPFYVDQNPSGSDSWSFFTRGFPVTYSEEYLFSPNWHLISDSTTYMNMRYGTSIVRAGIGLLGIMANYPQLVAGLAVADLGDGASLQVSWQPAAAANITGYRLYWGRASGAYTDSANVPTVSDTITGLLADSLHFVAVAAVDGQGRLSPFLTEVTGTPRAAPLAPAPVTAKPVAGGVRIDWAKNAELDLAGYSLCRRVNNGSIDSLTALTDTTFTDQPLSGADKYYYSARAYDLDGNASPFSAEAYGRPYTFDQGILLVDETKNWTTGNYPRDTTQDKYYHAVLSGYTLTDYEFDSVARKPVLADFAPYSTVVWHTDDRDYFLAANDTAALKDYLGHGGNLLFSGWQPLADVRNSATYPASFSAGSFAYDCLKISQVSLSHVVNDTFVAARGTAGYPDVLVDSAKVPLVTWKGTMRYIEALTPVSPAEGIYTIDMRNNGSSFEGQTCGIRYLGADYKLAYLGYPLLFMRQDQARALMQQVMADFGETGVAGLPAPLEVRGLGLAQSRPNPFKHFTTINYQIPKSVSINLAVYNIAGQRVRTLTDGVMAAGSHKVMWDGRDEAGSSVSGGVYLYRLQAAGKTLVGKMTILR